MKLTFPEAFPLFLSSSPPQPVAPTASTDASRTRARLTLPSLVGLRDTFSSRLEITKREPSPSKAGHAAKLLEEVALDEKERDDDRNRRRDRAGEEEREVRAVDRGQRAQP